MDGPAAPEPGGFSFGDAAFRDNPYPSYKFLRETMPVWQTPDGRWVLSRHEDATAILRDPRFGHNNSGIISDEIANEPILRGLTRTMLLLDPPAHTRLRGLVAKAFNARRVEELRPRILQIVDQLIDAVIGRGEMDIIRDFAHKLPVTVICDMLGIPEHDRERFLHEGQVRGRILDPVALSREDLDAANAHALEMDVYWRSLFTYRRANPGPDLTTALLAASENDDSLSDEEIIANIGLLLGAGHETTTNLIGNGLLALARNPAEWQKLYANPNLIPGAIEELLRYDSPVQLTARTTMEDVDIAGTAIAKGAQVIALLGAANHDPAAYAGDPDTLDVSRANVKPVSFGGGIHFCLGAQLARIEGEIAFTRLFERLPKLRVVAPDAAVWKPTITLRGLETLPAVF